MGSADGRERVGKAGKGKLSASRWSRVIPQNLRHVYRAGSRSQSPPPPPCKTEIDSMLHSLRTTTNGIKRARARASARAFLKLKTKEKCRSILDATPSNSLDDHKPKRFRLPGMGGPQGMGGTQKRELEAWPVCTPPPPLLQSPPHGGERSLGPESIGITRRQRNFLQGAKGAEADVHCDTMGMPCTQCARSAKF